MENPKCMAVEGHIAVWKNKTKGEECHLTFTKETPYESKYLTHRVLPNIDVTCAVHAEQMVDVLHEFNRENTIKAILVDNTNANIGCEGRMVVLLEKKIKSSHNWFLSVP